MTWISVKERVPSHNKEILCCEVDESGMLEVYVSEYYDGAFWYNYGHEIGKTYPTHWCEIPAYPAPDPEEEEEEEWDEDNIPMELRYPNDSDLYDDYLDRKHGLL